MNVAIITLGVYPLAVGGVEIHTFNQALGLAARHHRVQVYTKEQARPPSRVTEGGVPFRALGPDVPVIGQLLFIIETALALVRERRNIDIVHVHYATYFLLPAFFFNIVTGTPFVVTCHGYDVLFLGRNAIWKIVLRAMLVRASAITTPSEALKTFVAAAYRLGVRRVALFPNGVDVGEIERAKSLPPSRDGRRVILVANLRPVKDPLTAAKAFEIVASQIRDIHFVVVGDGSLMRELHSYIQKHQLVGVVEMKGSMGHPDALSEIWKSDCLVLSSISEGGIPLVVLEAMASGKPVVATAVGGVREIITVNVYVNSCFQSWARDSRQSSRQTRCISVLWLSSVSDPLGRRKGLSGKRRWRCFRGHTKMEIVLSELCAGSRLSGSRTKFALVFHAEGLINDRIFELLKGFGRATESRFRPLLTSITPRCPMYYQDPWKDPLRLRLPKFQPSQAILSDFAAKLNELSVYYDIGYHGHFFGSTSGGYSPSFRRESVLEQFDREHMLLEDLGFRPRSYAGGWWFMTPWLVTNLEKTGYKLDTTLNNARKQYFPGSQPYERTVSGEPFWIGEGVLEVPSFRSFSAIFRDFVVSGRQRQNFAALAMHDYNLLSGPAASMIRSLMLNLASKERVISETELIDESTKWLQTNPKVR